MFSLLRFVPKNHLSFFVGRLVRLKLPSPLRNLALRVFVRFFRVEMAEAEKPLTEYQSIGDLFVRSLRPGARPVGTGVVSPVDGRLRDSGNVEGDRLLQVKDKTYSFSALVGSSDLAAEYNGSYYYNFYLSPPDYHHIHAPISGEVTYTAYIPGKLWPVNDWAFHHVTDLFAVNERVIMEIRSGGSRALVVMVGATNVGHISLTYCDLHTNDLRRLVGLRKPEVLDRNGCRASIEKGERIGTFHMGSSVVLFIQAEDYQASPSVSTDTPRRVRYGETIGLSVPKRSTD